MEAKETRKRNLMVKRVLIALLVLAFTASAFAQKGPRLLKQQDVLRIQVYGQNQIAGDATIDTSGDITPPFLNTVHAEGRTVDDLIAELTRLYRQRLLLKAPIVSVQLLQLRPSRATIGGGGILRPGTINVIPGDTVLTLFNQGGGANQDAADLRRAYLRRAGTSESVPVDLYALTVFGDTTQNYEIQDGDELIVPEARGNTIGVSGAVQRPGLYPYREPTTAWDAIGLAGGEIRLRSRFSRTVVLRQRDGLPGEYVRIPIDLVRFIRKGDSTQNIQLQARDIIFVPETNTPDFAVLSQLGNTAFLLNSLGGLFGIDIFRR